MFDGIVTLEDAEIPVVVRFDSKVLQLTSNGAHIGEWAPGEYVIDQVADGVYSITAENESLHFIPSQPRHFAEQLTTEMRGRGAVGSMALGRHLAASDMADSTVEAHAPSINPLAKLGFYALSAMTAGLGLWAFVSIFF